MMTVQDVREKLGIGLTPSYFWAAGIILLVDAVICRIT
jgi:hypothetical protein